MFLITTADRRFWKTDEPVLFLGDWCTLLKDRAVWSSLDREVLPYHWADREKFAADWVYLDSTYEKYLGLLAERLNGLHGVRYSHRYWRILVGLWLRSFIDALSDRYTSIIAAENTGRVTGTWICSTAPWTPAEIPSFSFDAYNLYLYSRIIKFRGTIPFSEKLVSHLTEAPSELRPPSRSRFSRIYGELNRQMQKGAKTVVRQGLAVLVAEAYPRLVRNIRSDVIFAGSMYLTVGDQVRLQLSLHQVPFLYHGEKIALEPERPDPVMRRALACPESADPFERLLNDLLPDQVPMVYVEQYQKIHERVLAISPVPPKVALTAFSMNYRRCFEFWAAYHSERHGMKILIAQHGGGYGTARHLSVERHFLRISDRYYTWGSRLDGERNVKPMPSFRLRKTAQTLNASNPAGRIMWVGATAARYKTFAESGFVGPHILQYLREQERFLSLLSDSSRSLLLLRYFNELWEERERWSQIAPDLQMQWGRKARLGEESDFLPELKKCRLAVHTINETTYLETLAANFPSIVFWNPSYYETRPSLQPYFDELRAAGILHYTPDSAAAKVNEIHQSPDQWWKGADVQRARANFCHALARTSESWLHEWHQELASWQSGNCERGESVRPPIHVERSRDHVQ